MTVVNLGPKGLVLTQAPSVVVSGKARLGLALLCSLAEIRPASLPGSQASGSAGLWPAAQPPFLSSG